MKFDRTQRGFARAEFEDLNGVSCSVQKSSIATEHCIWLGCNDAEPIRMVPGEGWKPFELPPNSMVNTRMHLSQENAAALIPVLQRFVDTGEPWPWCDGCGEVTCQWCQYEIDQAMGVKREPEGSGR